MQRLTAYDYRSAVRMMNIKCDYSYSAKDSAMFHCCFHKDNNPSMSINFRKGGYNCFSCGKHGSINSLSKELTGKSIYQLLGITQDFESLYYEDKEENKNDVQVVEDKPKVVLSNLDIRGVTIPYNQSLEAKQYLTRRGITDRVATELGIEYTTFSYINGTGFYKRVLIPVYDEAGTLINMEGRAVDPKDGIKCLYPKNAVKPLFEYYKLDKSKPLFVFEGIIKMAVAREDSYFTNSTSTLGAKLSEFQIKLLSEFKDIIIIPDNDDPGEKILKTIKDLGYKGNMNVLRIRDDEIKDVDEVWTKLNMPVSEYRKNGGFVLDYAFS